MTTSRVMIYQRGYVDLIARNEALEIAKKLSLTRLPISVREDNITQCFRGMRHGVLFIKLGNIPLLGVRLLISLQETTVILYDSKYNFCTKDGKELSVDELIELINAPS